MEPKMRITRNDDKTIATLSIQGFPARWPPWRVLNDCLARVAGGTASAVDLAVKEAVDAGMRLTQDDGSGSWAFVPKSS